MFVSRALSGFSFIELLRLYLALFQDSLSLDHYIGISRTFKILFHWIITLVSRTFQDFFHWIVASVSRALLRFLSLDCYVRFSRTFRISFIGLLRLYLAHFQDFFRWTVAFVSRALLGFLSLDCYVRISRTVRILFHWIVAFVFSALLGFSFIGLLRLYLAHFQDSLSFVSFVSISISISRSFRNPIHSIITLVSLGISSLCDRHVSMSSTFRILFHWIVAFVFRALLGFFFIGFLHQYLAHFKNSLSLDCYVCISSTFRILFHWIVTFVS